MNLYFKNKSSAATLGCLNKILLTAVIQFIPHLEIDNYILL